MRGGATVEETGRCMCGSLGEQGTENAVFSPRKLLAPFMVQRKGRRKSAAQGRQQMRLLPKQRQVGEHSAVSKEEGSESQWISHYP